MPMCCCAIGCQHLTYSKLFGCVFLVWHHHLRKVNKSLVRTSDVFSTVFLFFVFLTTRDNNNRFTALFLVLPGWAGTRRNTHPPSCSSSNLYQLLPSTMIHSILLVQITCLAIFLHNLFSCPLWYPSWSGALHLIFHSFLHPVSVFFSQHMPIPSQPVLV